MTKQELHDNWEHRSTYHAPRDDKDRAKHEMVNETINQAGHRMIEICSDSKDTQTGLDALAVARMWFNSDLATNRGLEAIEKEELSSVDAPVV